MDGTSEKTSTRAPAETTPLSRHGAGLLLVVLLLAGALRFTCLSKYPAGLQVDEASIAFTAYLVSSTGRDDAGNRWPLYPQSLWNPKHPVYFFPSMASVSLLGLNETAARLPAAVFGVLAVVAVYFLALELFGSTRVALGAAFLLAVSPWHVHFSRFGIEASALPAVLTTGILFLARGVKRHPAWLAAGGLVLGLAFYTYPVALAFVPPFLAGFFLIYRRTLAASPGWSIAAAAIVAAMFLPMALGIFSGTGMDSYFESRSITGPAFHARAEEYLTSSKDPVRQWIGRHAAARTAYAFVSNYAGYFSPSFLFLRGDDRSILHNSPHFGMMNLACLPLLAAGLAAMMARRGREHQFMLWWFVLFPVGASLMTWGDQHAIRSITALPALQVISAVGLVCIVSFIGRRSAAKTTAAAAVICLLVTVNAAIYFRHYFTDYAAESANFFNYGFREAFEYLENNRDGYESVIVSDRIPYIYAYVFFYVPPSPGQVAREPDSGRLDLQQTFTNIGFRVCDLTECLEKSPHPALAMARPGQLPPGIYAKRFSGGYFRITPVKSIAFKENEPNVSIARVDDLKIAPQE